MMIGVMAGKAIPSEASQFAFHLQKSPIQPSRPSVSCTRVGSSPCYTWRVRRLIVNADDFGFTSGVNRAIIEAHTEGVVTSSTLMATGRAFPEAVQLAKSSPALSIGCHVVLIDGEPVLDFSNLPTITDSRGFRNGLRTFAARALTGRMKACQIEAETKAQIQKIQSAGLSISHLDTHKHTHIFPQ